MNSTGVKLNAQALRNAEFYGEFKKLAYEIATEQLNRWREWRIFTRDQIARMNEVELSSEFMLLILNGVLEKSNATINGFYSKYEKVFEDGPEVAHRFRTTFDTIEALFGKDTIAGLFRNRTVFFALFATVYGLQYGLRSVSVKNYGRLTKREKPKPMKPETVVHTKNAGAQIAERKNVPARVQKALRGATTHASERKVIIRLLAGQDDPCRDLN